MTELTPAGRAIIDRLNAGDELCAQLLGAQPSCPFWRGTGERPSSATVLRLFRGGVLKWDGERPSYPQFGRLVCRAADLKGGE